MNSSGLEAFPGEEWDNQHLPGVYALLVHKDASTRAWAQSMARRAGTVRSEEYLEVLRYERRGEVGEKHGIVLINLKEERKKRTHVDTSRGHVT